MFELTAKAVDFVEKTVNGGQELTSSFEFICFGSGWVHFIQCLFNFSPLQSSRSGNPIYFASVEAPQTPTQLAQLWERHNKKRKTTQLDHPVVPTANLHDVDSNGE
jgi:hypothetical protein